ncbi:NAD(P)H-dependent oxidoreductase [Flavobacteriales bacterium]|nr:NAD(P)H-dependent oxidoreductase [Flavobacteriales bacterium]
MNTLVLSSSLSKNSKSFLLCKAVEQELILKGNNITLVDARKIPMQPTHKGITLEMETLAKQVEKSDNIIFGMGVHCYSINDSLKILLDACFGEVTGKFFGILCAAGGERSYLSTMHLTQICMNEWRMMQLPRIVYATGEDFKNDVVSSIEVLERIKLFSEEFHTIGNKLIS